MLEIAKRVDAFMKERSPVHDTMRRLAKAFNDTAMKSCRGMKHNFLVRIDGDLRWPGEGPLIHELGVWWLS